jgi:Flp pilus assembly protein TadG
VNRFVRKGTRADGTGERASAAVEFALVLPLVLVMTLALVQVGLLVKDRLIVVESARAGARQASVSTDDGSVRQVAIEAAVSLDANSLDVVVDRQGGTGSPAIITVTYHAPVVVPLVSWLFPSSIDIRATATMRQETG